MSKQVKVPAERGAKKKQQRSTATAHLTLPTHALGKLYAGYILRKEKRQLNTAEAIDELSRAGAHVKMPSELLEAAGFDYPAAA